jgi:hypothetical protein
VRCASDSRPRLQHAHLPEKMAVTSAGLMALS